jgi:type IV pilus assembly protein PilA
MIIRPAVILALAVLCAPAFAATDPPVAASAIVPDSAVAVVELRGSLFNVRGFFDSDPALRSDLSAFLTRTFGPDLTTIESAIAWSSQLTPTLTFAALVRLPRGNSLHGGVTIGNCDGVDLIRLGDVVGASVPMGLLVGNEAEVRRAIMVAHKNAQPLAKDSPLAAALGERNLDFVATLDPAATGDKDVSAIAQQYGAHNVALSMGNGKLQLTISGDAQKLQAAQALLTNVSNAALVQLKMNMENAAQGNDVAEGTRAIITYHQAVKLWSQAAPKMAGGKLVSQYPCPDVSTMQSLGVVGILAAVAIPAYMKYIRRSKTVEATMNLRRLFDGAVSYYESHHGRFPKSTPWTPAGLCCAGDGGKCQPDAHAWDAPTWKALGFSLNEAHYYQYRVVLEGKGKNTVLGLEARGDLDCDGKFSLYRREVRLDEQGNLTAGAGLIMKDDLE